MQLERLATLFAEASDICQNLSKIELDATPERALMEPVKSAPFLTATDLAKRLQVDPKTVRRWRETRQLPPALEIGGVVRWRSQDIDAWIEEQMR